MLHNDAIEEVLHILTEGTRGRSREEVQRFAQAVTAGGIGLLRGVAGERFTAEYLLGALQDVTAGSGDDFEHPDNPNVIMRFTDHPDACDDIH